MVEENFTFNQKVYEEGEVNEYIYLIMNGEFEMTKDIFIKQDKGKFGFRRMLVDEKNPILIKLYSKQTQILLSTDSKEHSRLKRHYRDAYK